MLVHAYNVDVRSCMVLSSGPAVITSSLLRGTGPQCFPAVRDVAERTLAHWLCILMKLFP